MILDYLHVVLGCSWPSQLTFKSSNIEMNKYICLSSLYVEVTTEFWLVGSWWTIFDWKMFTNITISMLLGLEEALIWGYGLAYLKWWKQLWNIIHQSWQIRIILNLIVNKKSTINSQSDFYFNFFSPVSMIQVIRSQIFRKIYISTIVTMCPA